MYNGIGLQTARGSGTNGYVQRNLSSIRTFKDKINFRTEEEIQKLEATVHKGPNREILEHARKRALELKCAEMEDIMKQEGYSDSEVKEKVEQYRSMLIEREQNAKLHSSLDQFGKPNVHETHAVAEAQQLKNARLKEAFGISEYFIEGSSLDPDRKSKEEAARLAHQEQQEEEMKRKRKHEWINTPSPSPTRESSKKKDKKDKKKKKQKRERSSSRDSKDKKKAKKSKKKRK